MRAYHDLSRGPSCLSNARLSNNYGRCKFAASTLRSMVVNVDETSMKPAPSKLKVIAKMSEPANLEELRSFLGLTGCLHRFVPRYSVIAAPLTDLPRNKRERCILSGENISAQRLVRSNVSWRTSRFWYSLSGRTRSRYTRTLVSRGRRCPYPGSPFQGITHHQLHKSQVLENGLNRGPTERKGMVVLYRIPHYLRYLVGRRFALVIDWSALTGCVAVGISAPNFTDEDYDS